MASELKREPRPLGEVPARARPARASSEGASVRRASIASWFDAVDPRASRAPRSYALFYAVPPLVAAWVVAIVARDLTLRVAVPVALALVAVVAFFKARRGARVERAPSPRRGLGLTADRLSFESAAASSDLLHTDAPFGVTLLTDRPRERLTALLSSSAGTFSVGARLDHETRPMVGTLLDAASIAGDELGLDAIGPDGEPLLLAGDDFAALLERLGRSNPGCLDGFVLSDARGAPITLDAARLQIGDRAFDLLAPLEWRSLVFREALGNAHAYYQGTWVRQGAVELVLVSLLPAQLAPGVAEADIGELDRGALRDRRLMQASTEAPPPTEQRVAIERLFMLPLRAALDRAPRPSHRPNRAQA